MCAALTVTLAGCSGPDDGSSAATTVPNGAACEDSRYFFAIIVPPLPTRASWGNRDDRQVACSVISAGRAPLEASVKAPAER